MTGAVPNAANKARLEKSAKYVETHKVYQIFEGLLADLLVHKPADPIAHLIDQLKSTAVPKVVITGPPGSDTRTQCEKISTTLGLVHVYGPDLWREASKEGTANGLKAKEVMDSGAAELPDELLLDLVKEKLSSPDCVSKGWVLEGYPTTGAQVRGASASPGTFYNP